LAQGTKLNRAQSSGARGSEHKCSRMWHATAAVAPVMPPAPSASPAVLFGAAPTPVTPVARLGQAVQGMSSVRARAAVETAASAGARAPFPGCSFAGIFVDVVAGGLVAAVWVAGRRRRLTGPFAATSSRKRRATRGVVQLAADGDAEHGSIDLGSPFPFLAVVGQDEMKLALLLNMVDPSIGGCLIQGDRGTGKSTLVRALVRLLPDIPCVAGDKYNSDPGDLSTMSDEARKRVEAGEELPVVMRRTPFVELPLGATEDRVTGTIDIERALLEGGKAFEPGILARVNRGILYIDEVNLLDDQLVDVLLDSAAGGWNTVEREGVSVKHPARFILIGTAHPDEGDLRPQLLDRFGLTVSVRTQNDEVARMQILTNASKWSLTPEMLEAEFKQADEDLKAVVVEARKRLKDVVVPRETQIKISTVCSMLNVDGMRGDIVTNRTVRALAAYEGRTEVTEEDVRRVAVLTLQHRLRKDVVSDQADNSFRVLQTLNKVFKMAAPVEEAVEAVPA